MSPLLLSLLSLLFINAYAIETKIKECQKNEVYKYLKPCVETCNYKPAKCQKANQWGCYCADGYVRESNKTGSVCVKRKSCSLVQDVPVCGENEEYTDCGSACPPTCDDLRYPLPKPPKICILLCKVGCVCKNGYYRSNDGHCVTPDQCCADNEKYKTCGSACVETCGHKPLMCTRQCVAGCFCACSNYVRQNNSTNSPCIPRSDCPEPCDD